MNSKTIHTLHITSIKERKSAFSTNRRIELFWYLKNVFLKLLAKKIKYRWKKKIWLKKVLHCQFSELFIAEKNIWKHDEKSSMFTGRRNYYLLAEKHFSSTEKIWALIHYIIQGSYILVRNMFFRWVSDEYWAHQCLHSELDFSFAKVSESLI